MDIDSTERFSDRAGDYSRYRPSYPSTLIDYLSSNGLNADTPCADIGAGTGILSKLLLDHAERVFAIEPNEAMRLEAEAQLGMRDGYHSIPATAEDTFLGDATVGLICVAQAFHWFDTNAFRAECQRILTDDGQVAIIWNEWELVGDAISAGYEAILRRHTSHQRRIGNHRCINEDLLSSFFGHHQYSEHSFPNVQQVDFNGLLGRMRSSSIAPRKGTAEYAAMVHELEELHADHANDGGLIELRYNCRCCNGTF